MVLRGTSGQACWWSMKLNAPLTSSCPSRRPWTACGAQARFLLTASADLLHVKGVGDSLAGRADHDARDLQWGGLADHMVAVLRLLAVQSQSELVKSKEARALGISESRNPRSTATFVWPKSCAW